MARTQFIESERAKHGGVSGTPKNILAGSAYMDPTVKAANDLRAMGIAHPTAAQIAAQKAKTGITTANQASKYPAVTSQSDVNAFARQLFDYYAPGESYNSSNSAAYLKKAYDILSGNAPMPDMSKPSQEQLYQRAREQVRGEKLTGQQADDRFRQLVNSYSGGTSATPTAPATSPTTTAAQSPQQALDIINNSSLDEGIKALFREVVRNWDPAKELNADNIISEFKNIQKNTIDPYFQQLSTLAIDDITKARDFGIQQRALETEAEGLTAKKNIENAQLGLEKSGMTFTGEGLQQLGGTSAYGDQVGGGIQTVQMSGGAPINKANMTDEEWNKLIATTPGDIDPNNSNIFIPKKLGYTHPSFAIPAKSAPGQPYGAAGFGMPEGSVNRANRLIASSSALRYKQQLEDLQRQAERYLGSQGAQGLFPGVTPIGGITGEWEQQKMADYANKIRQIAGQEYQNVGYQDKLKFNFGT